MGDDRALVAALEGALVPPVRLLARRSSPYASSFPLERLDVESGDGSRRAVMWKDLSPGALLPAGRRARGAGADAPSREPAAYDLLAGAGLGTATRLAAVHEAGRAWLFLEAVDGPRLEHVGDLGAWRAVAAWLARAHAVLGARAADAAWLPGWSRPDPDALRATGDRRIAALAGPLAAAVARAEAAAPAVIHGELYPANVVIGEGGRVCVLDWETIARGPALIDLAALTAGRWDEPGEPLADAYRRALPDPPAARDLQTELDACRLLVAARWLLAPAGWTPPPEQARDWLRDAEAIARRVGA
jgi:phosphotransferase family enzyme